MMLSKSFTYKEFRDTVLQHLERFSSNGRENTLGEVIDIEKRLPEILSARLRSIYDEYGIGRSLKKLEVGKYSLVYYGEDFTVESEEQIELPRHFSKFAYHLVASGSASVFFSDCQSSKTHRIDTADGEYIQLSGTAKADGEYPAMLLVGLDTLHIRSLEIVAVPDFVTDFLPIETDTFRSLANLPDNISRIIEICDEDGRSLSEEAFRPYSEYGVLAILARVDHPLFADCLTNPETVTEDNLDTVKITLPPILYDALCYACAADVCPSSDSEIAARLTYRYREILENVYDRHKDVSAGRNRFYGKIRRRGRL